MDESEVLLNFDEPGILQLVLNRPDELNAWTYSLESSLFAALDAAAADRSVRVVSSRVQVVRFALGRR